ncbi:MAG: sialate O-acetylesterase [Chryseolinea sp.]
MKRSIIFLLATLCCASMAHCTVRLPKIITDHMVIQRNKPITIWGWADPNESVTVQFKTQSKKSKAGKDGKWKVVLQPETAGGPFQMTVKGANVITISDILIGEVWVCSGQSNMEFSVSSTKNADVEIQQANYPDIRQFLVAKSVSSKPEEEVKGGDWKGCSPATAGEFTAVGYFFARDLYNTLKVPIGLINTSWGGTHSETWTSREAFENNAEFKSMISSMPVLDLDALAKERVASQVNKLKSLGMNVPAIGTDQWKSVDYDDKKWPTMSLPGVWERKGLESVDGVVWFRKTISISSADAGKPATVELGPVDDSDDTYVNGSLVGSMKNKYNENRKYNIPASVLKEGKNVIAIRVEDTGGDGGVNGEDKDMKLTMASGAVVPLSGDWTYNVEKIEATTSVGPNSYPTLLFNAMINPILHAGIAGVIWYQGESNAGRAYQYRTAFPLMIQDWRRHWNQGDVPFYFVQLASFNSANGDSEHGSTWAELREAQTMTLSLPHTGMAVTTDIGEANDIHPRNKQDVGKRLAAVALHDAYAKDVVFSGPVYQSMKVEGDKVRIVFGSKGSGLMVKDKYGYLKGFELAGSDQKFHYAKAWIEGGDVVVSCEGVSTAVAVRYGWADNPEDCNLFNKEGFPASPFRSDTWKGITESSKFSFN